MQSVSLADELHARAGATARDEVVCPGVEGPNLAGARARARSASATGWDGAAAAADDRQAHPGRGRDGRRLGRRRRGAAARRARRRARRRAAAARARRARSAPTCPAQVPPGAGAGVGGAGSGWRRCRDRGRRRTALARPAGRRPTAARHAAVYREADRLGDARARLRRRSPTARLRRAARRRAPLGGRDARRTTTCSAGARSLCPAIDDALAARARRAPTRARVRLRADGASALFAGAERRGPRRARVAARRVVAGRWRAGRRSRLAARCRRLGTRCDVAPCVTICGLTPMSNETIITGRRGLPARLGLVAVAGLILVPAWTAYTRLVGAAGRDGPDAVRAGRARRRRLGGALVAYSGTISDSSAARGHSPPPYSLEAMPTSASETPARSISTRSTRSPRRSSRARACPRSCAPPPGRSTRASC